MNFPNNEKVIDLACAAQFMVALTEPGNVYYWGKMQVSEVVSTNVPYLYEVSTTELDTQTLLLHTCIYFLKVHILA